MKRWLGRFAMSFLIIAMVLIWEAYKSPGTWKVYAFPPIAIVLFYLFLVGTRERHRSNRMDEGDKDSNEA